MHALRARVDLQPTEEEIKPARVRCLGRLLVGIKGAPLSRKASYKHKVAPLFFGSPLAYCPLLLRLQIFFVRCIKNALYLTQSKHRNFLSDERHGYSPVGKHVGVL